MFLSDEPLFESAGFGVKPEKFASRHRLGFLCVNPIYARVVTTSIGNVKKLLTGSYLPEMAHVGERLRKAIDASGMQHKAVADRAGMAPATLSKVLSATSKEPYWSTVVKIARAAAVSLDALALGPVESSLNAYDTQQDIRALADALQAVDPNDRHQILEFALWAVKRLRRTEPRHTAPEKKQRKRDRASLPFAPGHKGSQDEQQRRRIKTREEKNEENEGKSR